MKNKMRICLLVGMLLSTGYLITKRFVTIPDSIAYPICLISIALMLTGLIYQGWYLGKYKKVK